MIAIRGTFDFKDLLTDLKFQTIKIILVEKDEKRFLLSPNTKIQNEFIIDIEDKNYKII